MQLLSRNGIARAFNHPSLAGAGAKDGGDVFQKGMGPGRMVRVVPNQPSLELDRMTQFWGEVGRRGGIKKVCCAANKPYCGTSTIPPFMAMPDDGRRIQQVGSIVLPGVENTDTLVTGFRVQLGFEGVITSVMGIYTSTGFIEGSGDINYRIQINRKRWLKDYGNVITSLGTANNPQALSRGGLRVETLELVEIYVSLGTGSLGRLDPAGRIVCGLYGWVYPQE